MCDNTPTTENPINRVWMLIFADYSAARIEANGLAEVVQHLLFNKLQPYNIMTPDGILLYWNERAAKHYLAGKFDEEFFYSLIKDTPVNPMQP